MKLVLTVIIIGVLLLDLFCSSEAWWFFKSNCHPPKINRNEWFNSWDGEFKFTCPSGQAITEFHSLYSKCHYDRVFRFACSSNIAVAKGDRSECHWSHYVNNFNKLLSFKCPLSGFITGISSYHLSKYEDRRFKFRCCNLDHRFHRYHCSTGSHFLSRWRKPLDFKAPQDYFLVGATSYHGHTDRRWKFETCKVARNTHGGR